MCCKPNAVDAGKNKQCVVAAWDLSGKKGTTWNIRQHVAHCIKARLAYFSPHTNTQWKVPTVDPICIHLHCAFVFARSSGWQRLKKKQAFSSQSLNDLEGTRWPANGGRGKLLLALELVCKPVNLTPKYPKHPQTMLWIIASAIIRNHPQSSAIIRNHPHRCSTRTPTPTHTHTHPHINTITINNYPWNLTHTHTHTPIHTSRKRSLGGQSAK